MQIRNCVAYVFGPPCIQMLKFFICVQKLHNRMLYINVAADCCWDVFTSDSYTFVLVRYFIFFLYEVVEELRMTSCICACEQFTQLIALVSCCDNTACQQQHWNHCCYYYCHLLLFYFDISCSKYPTSYKCSKLE